MIFSEFDSSKKLIICHEVYVQRKMSLTHLLQYSYMFFIRRVYSCAMSNRSVLKDYGYLWITLALFVFSFAGHWTAGWFAYIQEQEAHNQPVQMNEYLIEMTRDTLENWQSEFLQLIWQVAGLSLLWYLGSPQSKEGDERKEEKIDALLKLNGKEGEKIIVNSDTGEYVSRAND